MKKALLILSLLTLSFGVSLAPANSFALSAEEEEKVNSLIDSNADGTETLSSDCNLDGDFEAVAECLSRNESTDGYNDVCKGLSDEEAEKKPECNVEESTTEEDTDHSEDSDLSDLDLSEEDQEFLDSFLSEEEEEEDSEPASILPVLITTVAGIVLIFALNLADRKK